MKIIVNLFIALLCISTMATAMETNNSASQHPLISAALLSTVLPNAVEPNHKRKEMDVSFILNAEESIIKAKNTTKKKTCEICQKACNNLTKHMRTHTGEKPFGCSSCSMTFRLSHHLSNHLRTHTQEKPFACSVCAARFTQSANLTRHMMLKHTGEKPFICEVCNYSTSLSHNLKLHMIRHSNNGAQYPCRNNGCGSKFSHSHNRARHEKKICKFRTSNNQL